MTALEKLAIKLKPMDAYDGFLSTFIGKCPDEVFHDAIDLCEAGFGDDAFLTCVKCWLQEISE